MKAVNEARKGAAIVAYVVKLGYLGGLSGVVDTTMHSHPEETNTDFVDFYKVDCDCPASLKGYVVLGSHLAPVNCGHPFAEESEMSCYTGS